MITKPYLLIVQIPYYIDEQNNIYMDRLWRLDFEMHLDYIQHLYLAAPALPLPKNPDRPIEKVNIPANITLELIPLNYRPSTINMILNIPKLAVTLFKAIKKVDIVHSGVIGWPLPIGWIANPITLLLNKKLIIMIESAPWRDNTKTTGIKQRIMRPCYELAAKYFVNKADLAIFNQQHFKDTLLKNNKNLSFVYPTVWLKEENILTGKEAQALWQNKPAPNESFKIIYAGRLVENKGVKTLIEALKIIDPKGLPISCSIIGDGDLFDYCRAQAETLASIQLHVQAPIAYGDAFFNFIKQHHAFILPCILDEQPRILLDAFSQSIPVIGSDIPGLQHHIKDSKTGLLFRTNDAADLAEKILAAYDRPKLLADMGMNALAFVRKFSHNNMHQERHKLLLSAFEKH